MDITGISVSSELLNSLQLLNSYNFRKLNNVIHPELVEGRGKLKERVTKCVVFFALMEFLYSFVASN